VRTPATTATGRIALCAVVAIVAGCASGPPPADWQINAQSGVERGTTAYLAGNPRVESVEFNRARSEIARTGRVDLLARAELVRCAARVASLVFEPCAGFETVRVDAPASERAYADYLAGRLGAANVALLPPGPRAVAAVLSSGSDPARAIQDLTDPLSRLVAAAVVLQAGRVDPAVVSIAIDAASAQGWPRPLLAWLGVQAALADRAGDTETAQRARRRMQQVSGAP
jgi:hypothetical protein